MSNSRTQRHRAGATNALAALDGKRILLTGATGFVGKLFLAILLRECPGIGGITLLVRLGKGKTAAERLENDVFSAALFEGIGGEQKAKVEAVHAELAEARLGLDDATFASLAERVDLIVNCAANVDFRAPLDDALNINVRSLSTLAALALTKSIPFVHVSTIFVSGLHKGTVHEQLLQPLHGHILPDTTTGQYDIPSLVDEMLTLCTRQSTTEKRIELGLSLARKHGFNDTYTLTKWMGEAYLRRELSSANSMLTILRPSIVESCLAGSHPGWIEGIKVADAVIFGYARKGVDALPGREAAVLDVVPADVVANAMLLASADLLVRSTSNSKSTDNKQQQQVLTIHVGTSTDNPITVGKLWNLWEHRMKQDHEKLDKLLRRKPTKHLNWIPRAQFDFRASVAGSLLGVAGALVPTKGTRQAKEKFDRAAKLAGLFGFYTSSEAVYDCTNLHALAQRTGFALNVDTRRMNWEEYAWQHLVGLNRYALRPLDGDGSNSKRSKHVKTERCSACGDAEKDGASGHQGTVGILKSS